MKLFDRLGKLRDRRRPYCTMIVPAAGESRRMGGGNKLLLPLEGEPVLAHTLRAIDAATLVDEIILSTRTECLAEMAELCRRCGLQKPVRVVVGGETRTHSVLAAALEANEKARLIVWEMTERLALDLLEKRLAGNQVVLDVGYDIDNLTDVFFEMVKNNEEDKDKLDILNVIKHRAEEAAAEAIQAAAMARKAIETIQRRASE